MLAIWMLYTLVVSALVGAAVAALEGPAARRNLPLRGLWILGFFGALAVVVAPGPTLTSSWAGVDGGGVEIGAVASLVAGGEVLADGTRSGSGAELWIAPRVDRWLTFAWGLAVGFLLLSWIAAAVRTRRRSRTWPDVVLPEGRVLLSDAVGPGVVGILRNRVVLPRWCLELPPMQRSLVLAHEREHVRARDTLAITAATVLTLLMPWNLPFWGYLRRLRAAVEMDCDARVVRRHPEARRAYGELLIAVASRGRTPGLALATFSQDSSTLGRRIRMLSLNSKGITRPQALLLTAGGLLLLAGACLVPGPDRGEVGITGPEAAEVEGLEDLARQPAFTPMEVRPELRNGSEVQRTLQAAYPQQLRDAGIGGTTVLHIFIDEEGTVRNTEVSQASGHDGLDDAAARVAESMDFSPALNRDEPVPVWIEMPITFQTRETSQVPEAPAGEAREAAVADRATPDAVGEEPTFTPMEVRPELRNGGAMQELLRSEYPVTLRDAGIGGTAVLHLFIDEEGTVRNTEVSQSSGYEALDEAAARVAAEMDFSPALNRGERVPVWIEMPISFMQR